MDVGTIAGWVCEAYRPRRRGHYMAEIMTPGPAHRPGGWVVRFQDTGRYYVTDQEGDTDDLDRAATYSTQAEARGAVDYIKQSWVDPGPLEVVSLTAARVEAVTGRRSADPPKPTGRVTQDPPMQQLKPEADADLEALKHALGWDPRGMVPIDQRTLPTELEHMLRVSMPPGNLTAGGFEGRLVSLFADADAWNFVRLAQGFPLHGVAVVLWDAGLVYPRSASRDVGWGADWKLVDDRALWTWLKRPDKTWRQKFDGVRFILNSPRTSSQGRQVSLPEVDHGR
jgi:hypothetical protein